MIPFTTELFRCPYMPHCNHFSPVTVDVVFHPLMLCRCCTGQWTIKWSLLFPRAGKKQMRQAQIRCVLFFYSMFFYTVHPRVHSSLQAKLCLLPFLCGCASVFVFLLLHIWWAINLVLGLLSALVYLCLPSPPLQRRQFYEALSGC